MVAAPIVAQLLRALRRSASFADSDHQAFLADLMEQRFEPSARVLVLDALLESARALSPAAVSVALEAPIYPDESGELRRLASWSATSDDACHRAGELRSVLRGAGLPLLAAEEEARLSDFLDVIGLLPASPVDLIRHAGVIDDPERVLAALLPLAAELDEGARSALAELRLFETRSGRHVTASELCDPAPFEAVFPSALDRLALGDRLGTADAICAARALELATYAPGRVVETELWPALTLGAPLSEQPHAAAGQVAASAAGEDLVVTWRFRARSQDVRWLAGICQRHAARHIHAKALDAQRR